MDLKSAELYFHLGLPKVASTYFQQLIFPNIKGVIFYRKHHFLKYKELDSTTIKGKCLFSSEKEIGLIESTQDIVNKFPQARIMLFFRKHDDWILSRYKYYIRKHGHLPFEEYLQLPVNEWIHKEKSNYFQSIIDQINDLCAEAPLVLTHTLLVKQPDDFISRVLDFIGSSLSTRKKLNPIHNAFNNKQLVILRRWNKFYPYDHYKYPNRTINKLHRKYRDLLLHSIAFFVKPIPKHWLPNEELMTVKDLEKLQEIGRKFEGDWSYCENYFDNTRN